MKYGHFDDLNKEYVIDTPRTPLPWINYLGTNGFFSLISNTSGGYCFYKDAKNLIFMSAVTVWVTRKLPVSEMASALSRPLLFLWTITVKYIELR